MASKLDYLKKYLAKPGDAEASRKPTPAASYCPDAARPHKEKKKRKKGAVLNDPSTIHIRDLSEALPAARNIGEQRYFGKQAKLLSLNLDEDEARLARDGELDFVDPEDVVEAAKIDVERSDIKWKMQNHKKPSKQAKRAPLVETKAEVVKEEKNEGASDSDMSPARAPARGSAAAVSQDADNDLSPPRGGTNRAQTAAGEDLSPPRAKADLSPSRRPAAAKTMARRARNDSDADMSPPRKPAASVVTRKGAGSDGDLSPPRAQAAAARTRNDSDADLSPPRGRTAASGSQQLRHDSDADLSPPRKGGTAAGGGRHDSDADLSPPRQGKPAPDVKKEADADLSPPRGRSKPQRHDSDADMSPPRKSSGGAKAEEPRRTRHDSDADVSPPRKSSAASKSEAPKRTRHDSDADVSPPRKAEAPKRARHDSDADLSPPRKGEAPARARHDSDSDMSPPRGGAPRAGKDQVDENGEEKMSSGLSAGIISGAVLKEQAAKVREDRQAALAAAPDSETGKGATTVYRSRAGGQVSREEWVEQQGKKRKKKMSEYPEQKITWGGGLAQESNAEEAKDEASRVAALPFARYELEESAVQALQDRQSWNDPMSKFDADEEERLASASVAPAVKKPRCPHAPWANRFGILPGYRWDGAVRGTTYDKRWLEAKNARALYKTEKYKYERLED